MMKNSEKSRVKYGSTNPAVNPSHYTSGKYEAIDIIEDQLGLGGLRGFCLGNVLKYTMRAGKKDPNKTIEDLEKASWYLTHYIERRKSSDDADSIEKEQSIEDFRRRIIEYQRRKQEAASARVFEGSGGEGLQELRDWISRTFNDHYMVFNKNQDWGIVNHTAETTFFEFHKALKAILPEISLDHFKRGHASDERFIMLNGDDWIIIEPADSRFIHTSLLKGDNTNG